MNEALLAERLHEWMASEKIPGLAFSVVRQQETLCARGFGVTSVEVGGQPVTPETLFRIGSITKALTGAAIGRLVDAGLLELEAPVARYLPWLELNEPGAAQQVTLRMLLTHTAGLPTDVAVQGSRDPEGLERFLRTELRRYPLVAPPGRLYRYSNLGFSLLGHVAEAVTGQPYAALMRTWVFEPLQMERTTLDPTLAMSYPLSQSHRLEPDGSLAVIRPFADSAAFAPAGFAYSTVLDLACFAQMLLAGGEAGGGRFLSREWAAAMQTVQVPNYSPGDGGRGLGLFVDPHPRSGIPRAGHMGGITGFRGLFELYPEAGAAIVILMNRAAPIGKVRDILLEECLGLATAGWEPSLTEPDPGAWAGYTGVYLSDSEGLARVYTDGSGLWLDWNGREFPLACHGSSHYVVPLGTMGYLGAGFLSEPEGEVRYLMLGEAPYRRIETVAGPRHPDRWERYTGSYRLKQPPMTVRVEGGVLFLHSAFFGEEVRCVPLSDTEFACKWGRFAFSEAPDGSVVGIWWGGERFIPRVQV